MLIEVAQRKCVNQANATLPSYKSTKAKAFEQIAETAERRSAAPIDPAVADAEAATGSTLQDAA